MSLRSFHIAFIVLSLALCAFLAYWSGAQIWSHTRMPHHETHAHHHKQPWGLFIAAAAGLAAGLPYLMWFIKKTKKLS